MATIDDSQSRKRNHADFDDLADLEEPCSVPPDFLKMLEDQEPNGPEQEQPEMLPTPPTSIGDPRAPSPVRSSYTSGLSDARAVTPSWDQTPSAIPTPSPLKPSAFALMNAAAPPLAKKPKLTDAEQELRKINREIKEKEKAEEKARREKAQVDEKARKEAIKKTQADEKAKRDAEKDAERRKKEAEKEEKRIAAEAEKAVREEKRRKKEEEKQRKEDEKRKKERNQLKLGNFFAIPASSSRSRTSSVDSDGRRSMSPTPQSIPTSAASALAPVGETSSKPRRTPYEEMFPAFYRKDDVTLAPISRFERDDEAIEVLQATIDGYLVGKQIPDTQRAFDPLLLFHLEPGYDLKPRGRQYVPVREIMSELAGSSSMMAIDLTTTDSQNSQIKRTSEMLRRIPMKILHFNEDVRPPYKGTFTKRPVTSTMKLARNPLRKDLPNTDYGYDSEAEWVEDEDGEDLKSDGEEDEDVDDGEDMDGFLDDEGDETANSKRLVIQGDLEPVSTGLCWEDRTKRNSNVKMMKYRMEIILSPALKIVDPGALKSINPFSEEYWAPVPKPASMEPPRLPLNMLKNTSSQSNSLPSSSKSVKPLFPGLVSTQPIKPTTSKPSASAGGKKMIPVKDLPDFKAAIEGSDLSKVGLIEVLKKAFSHCTGNEVKNTLEAIAKRGEKGQKEKDKRWVLIDP